MSNRERAKSLNTTLANSNPHWLSTKLHVGSQYAAHGTLSAIFNAAGDAEIEFAQAIIAGGEASEYVVIAYTADLLIRVRRTGNEWADVETAIYPRSDLRIMRMRGGPASSLSDTFYDSLGGALIVDLTYAEAGDVTFTDRYGSFSEFIESLRADLVR